VDELQELWFRAAATPLWPEEDEKTSDDVFSDSIAPPGGEFGRGVGRLLVVWSMASPADGGLEESEVDIARRAALPSVWGFNEREDSESRIDRSLRVSASSIQFIALRRRRAFSFGSEQLRAEAKAASASSTRAFMRVSMVVSKVEFGGDLNLGRYVC
jgi:hypothetical protein